MGLSRPWDPIRETGMQTLIGADDQVTQYDYGPTVDVTVGSDQPASGLIRQLTFVSGEAGGGAVLSEAGVLYVLDADPNTSVGDANLTLAELETVIAKFEVAAADWKEENSGAAGCVAHYKGEWPFHACSTLYLVYYHEGATTYNSAAGDEETLKVNIWYERYS